MNFCNCSPSVLPLIHLPPPVHSLWSRERNIISQTVKCASELRRWPHLSCDNNNKKPHRPAKFIPSFPFLECWGSKILSACLLWGQRAVGQEDPSSHGSRASSTQVTPPWVKGGTPSRVPQGHSLPLLMGYSGHSLLWVSAARSPGWVSNTRSPSVSPRGWSNRALPTKMVPCDSPPSLPGPPAPGAGPPMSKKCKSCSERGQLINDIEILVPDFLFPTCCATNTVTLWQDDGEKSRASWLMSTHLF